MLAALGSKVNGVGEIAAKITSVCVINVGAWVGVGVSYDACRTESNYDTEADEPEVSGIYTIRRHDC